MSVKIVIGNIYSKIVGILPDPVNEDLSKILSYRVPDARFIPKVKEGKWDGVIRLYYKDRGQAFYTGLLSLVRDTLKKHNEPFELLDRRVRPAPNMPDLTFKPPPFYESRDYQDFTIDRSLKFTRGVLGVCTGGGKTLIVARMISQIKTYPFIFYVLTKDLMEQAHEVLSTCLNQPIGIIGDGKCDIKKISVCTIQTATLALHKDDSKFKISDYTYDDEDAWDEKGIESAEKAEKIKKLIQLANGVYMDECHHISSRTCKDVFTASPNAYWRFGGSATPYRDSGDEIMIQALLGGKIVDISASYLIKKDYLVRPYIFFEPIDSKINLHSYAKIYEACIAKNASFNNHVAATARHLVSRGLSTLILVKQYSQGDYLKTLIPDSVFVTSRLTSSKRTQMIEDLRQKKIKVMIATSLADEGLNIPVLNAALIAGGGKSSTRLHQRIGRTLRKDKNGTKDKSIVIVYDHNARHLNKHVKVVRRHLKKETEFVLRDSRGPDFICGEIDDVLGVKNERVDLFNA